MLYVTKNHNTLFYINYKCCYSTFYELAQRGILINLDNNGICLNLELCKTIFPKITSMYIIVRSPYSRLLSFYNDKFLKCFVKNKSINQMCQNNMYKYFSKDKLENINFKFSDLIEAMKKGYSDAHIHNQTNILKQKIILKQKNVSRQRIQDKQINVLKMEDPDFNNKLSKLLNTEIPKTNSTESVENKITINDISAADKDYIYNLYKTDFITFKYNK
jgi:hypothetical protein